MASGGIRSVPATSRTSERPEPARRARRERAAHEEWRGERARERLDQGREQVGCGDRCAERRDQIERWERTGPERAESRVESRTEDRRLRRESLEPDRGDETRCAASIDRDVVEQEIAADPADATGLPGRGVDGEELGKGLVRPLERSEGDIRTRRDVEPDPI